jgi:hypothetical protein
VTVNQRTHTKTLFLQSLSSATYHYHFGMAYEESNNFAMAKTEFDHHLSEL